MFVIFRMLSGEFRCTALISDYDLLQILTDTKVMIIWYKCKVQAQQLNKLDIIVILTFRLAKK